MDVIDRHIAEKERQLDEYLSSLNDPRLRQMLSDLSALRRTKEIVAGATIVTPLPPVAPSASAVRNGHSVPPGVVTQGDAVVEMMSTTERPMHINEIMQELELHYQIKPKNKQSLLSNIRKDRQNRFKSRGGGFWTLRDKHVIQPASESAPTRSGNGVSPFARAGFSLVGAIKELLPHLHGEFSQPIVYNKLREKHPEVAEYIQKASVATTLRKLELDGLIEITYQGYGSEPRRYKRKAA